VAKYNQGQLEGMSHRACAVFRDIVGEQMLDLYVVLLVERQHAIVQHMDRRGRTLEK
jgi:hypothetical protein